MSKPFLTIFRRLEPVFGLGANLHLPDGVGRRVVLANKVACVFVALSAFFAAYTLAHGQWTIALQCILGIVLSALIPLINGLGHHRFARVYAVLQLNLNVLVSTLLTAESAEVESIFFPLVGVAIAIFSPRERALRTIGCLLPVACYGVNLVLVETGSWELVLASGTGFLLCYVITSHIDSANERVEAELREREGIYRTVFDNAPVGIVRLGPDGRWLEVNDRYAAFLGRTKCDIATRRLVDLTHPDDWPNDADAIAKLTSGELDTWQADKRYLRPDGTVVWGRLLSTIVREADGSVKYFISTVEDITGRVAAETALRESTARFGEMAAHIDDVYWTMSLDEQRVVYVSPSFEKIWGRPTAELSADIGVWLRSIHPDDVPALMTRRGDADAPFDLHYRIIRPDGEIRWIWDRFRPVKDATGRVVRLCGAASDVTAHKEAERIIAEQQAKIIASAKMSSLGEMAGGIAHEINNPIAAIHAKAMKAKMRLQSGALDAAEMTQTLVGIEALVMRVGGIIKALRTFARDGENDPLVEAPLAAIVQDTLELCREKLRHHDVALVVRGVETVALHCRPVQISQVLLNLLSNSFDAIEALPERWIEVEAEASAGWVELRVTDSGAGIRPELRGKIMQPFFTTKEVGRGTGLGLSISQGIVEDHGGTLALDDRSPNTSFVARLPRRPTPRRRTPEAKATEL